MEHVREQRGKKQENRGRKQALLEHRPVHEAHHLEHSTVIIFATIDVYERFRRHPYAVKHDAQFHDFVNNRKHRNAVTAEICNKVKVHETSEQRKEKELARLRDAKPDYRHGIAHVEVPHEPERIVLAGKVRTKYYDAEHHRQERTEGNPGHSHEPTEYARKHEVAEQERGIRGLAGSRVAVHVDHLLQRIVQRDNEGEPQEPAVELVHVVEQFGFNLHDAEHDSLACRKQHDHEHADNKRENKALAKKAVSLLLVHAP